MLGLSNKTSWEKEFIMRSFLGEHFLRRFAGALKRRLQVPVSEIKEINAEADQAFAIDENAANEKREKTIVNDEEKLDGKGQ
jgi:hypothetical protein